MIYLICTCALIAVFCTGTMLQYRRKLKFANSALSAREKVLNNLPCPVWFRNSDLKIIYSNNEFVRIISDRVDNDAEDQEINKHQKALSIKASQSKSTLSEERYLVVDGKRKLYSFHEIPIESDAGMLGLAYDVSSKDQIRIELARHISAQSDLLDATSSAIVIYGPDTKVRFFNQAFIKLWGLDEKWMYTQPTYSQLTDLLREQRKFPEQLDYQQFKRDRLKFFSELTSAYNDFLYLPDGRSLRVIIVPHALGGLLFSYEDMTDRLALERSYKTLSAVQKETIDNLNEGIIVIAENGKVAISNAKFKRMWNMDQYDLEPSCHILDLLEKMFNLLKMKEDWLTFKNIFISNINLRKMQNIKIEKLDDSIIDVLFVPLPDGATLICYQDITDSMLLEKSLRERNQALKEADKLKTEFLANISYELRSPLTSIMGFSEALSKTHFTGLDETQKQYVGAINESSNHLMSLINDILELASIDAGYVQLDVVKFDIYQAVSSLLPLIKERVKQSKAKFKLNCDSNIGYMFGDVLRIKQVIFQLVNNAAENSKKGGNILLDVQKFEDSSIKISVEDDGYSVDKEDQSRIFDKFPNIYLKNKRNKKQLKGSALALAKSFIEMHEGRIELVPKIGDGTRFECVVPINHPEMTARYDLRISEEKVGGGV